MRSHTRAFFCFAPSFLPSGKTGKNTGEFPPQGPSQPSLYLGDEGKRFEQALFNDRSFIQAISSAIATGLSESAGKPHGSANRPELTGTKRSDCELDGPGDLVRKSIDSTSTGQLAKHFNRIFTLIRKSILL